MTIRVFDTLTGEPQELRPAPAELGIYACGPTVYAPIHVGNARPFVVFSLLKRFLELSGYGVTLAINITDVNDKIYAAAGERGIPSTELAREMIDRYIADTDRLELGRPDYEPRASETIGDIVALIGTLIDRGHAYAADGDVYFDVASFPGYGKLSNRRLDEMDQGEDDDAPGLKRDAHDFALWKAHKPGEDSAWDAPWGRGRPGWHIECSAMAEEILGLEFDIHGGGIDLVFPHHENEIAQTEAARGCGLARMWMHNNMVRFDDEKMSKSMGNIRLLSGALDEYGRDALVMYFVAGHYRDPIEFSPQQLEQARSSVDRVREFCRRVDREAPPAPEFADAARRFFDALSDDYNTPAALAALFELIRAANRRLDDGERVGSGAELEPMLRCLGLERLLEEAGGGEAEPAALALVDEREAARRERDFELADRKRDELRALGYEVRDTPAGPQLVPLR